MQSFILLYDKSLDFSLKESPTSLPVSAPLIEVDKEIDEQNFLLWRIEKGVAEGSTEIPKGVCLFPCKNSSSVEFF